MEISTFSTPPTSTSTPRPEPAGPDDRLAQIPPEKRDPELTRLRATLRAEETA